ncbi:MAG: molybdopterin-guanine dinucleotide biosynthesis protein B [Candidatus Electrothrix sp. AR3]|nr:molybdopterin-guanine dinucleotide biosynthesis protein B [Candidatus Electrothrix sp. AR3]
MPPIITFIGWHNCGKTTLATQVVRHLKERGYSVAVIKSTKETGLLTDQNETDTKRYRQAGADAVALAAPDQIVLTLPNQEKELLALVDRFCTDSDIVIGEGFKTAQHVEKIEVCRGSGKLLRDQVVGVVAVAADRKISGGHHFWLSESKKIADFIENRLLKRTQKPES